MKKCKIYNLPGVDLNKYTPIFQGKELLKQLFLDHSQTLKAYNIKLNIQQEKVSGIEPCTLCAGVDFYRTGTCHVCINCGSSQGCS